MRQDEISDRFDRALRLLEGLPEPLYANESAANARLLATCTDIGALIEQIAPGERTYKGQFESFAARIPVELSVSPASCRLVIELAKSFFSSGFHRLKGLVSAEVLDDLLDQASYLFGHGYHLPAGALAGAVLEDSLRKLCATHGVTWPGDSGISKLGTELYKAGILSKPQHGQVETWGKVRNDIDHGNFAKPGDVDPNDVNRMVGGVRDFIAKHLS